MFFCTRCEQLKDDSEFHIKDKNTGKLQAWCKSCRSEWSKNRPKEIKEAHNAKSNKNKKEKIRKLTKFVVEYLKNHPCEDCGYSNVLALEFHHVCEKRDSVAALMNSICSVEELEEEINKCIVLCANCHRIRTAVERNWVKLEFL